MNFQFNKLPEPIKEIVNKEYYVRIIIEKDMAFNSKVFFLLTLKSN